MSPLHMTDSHHSTEAPAGSWTLCARHARRLRAAPRRRWLAVEAGRVWLTRSQRRLEPPEDLWLVAGQRLALPPGSDWVVEAWPEARLALLESPDPA